MRLDERRRGDVRGADRVTARDGGQTLDVRTDEPTDHGGLGLAQLWEFRGNVGNRAVVLAQLPTSGQSRGGGSVALAGQRSGQGLSPVEPVGSGRAHRMGTALLEPGELVLGECRDCFGTAAAREMAQCGYRQVVICVRETLPAGAGQCELAGRAAAATAVFRGSGVSLDPALVLQCIEVPADGCCGDAEFGCEVGRAQRALPPEQVDHPIAGTAVVRAAPADVCPELRHPYSRGQDGGFHNNSVTYFLSPFHQGSPKPSWRWSLSGAAYADRMPAQLAASRDRPPSTVPFGIPLTRFALVNLIAQVSIVLTGGAVRLTGSGLGCSTVPRCTEDSFFPTPELGIHGLIEFSNRALGYVVGIVAVATFLAVWRSRRRDLYGPAIVVAVGVAAQGVLGGITVLTGLNPWTVMCHFLVSMSLVAAATQLWLRAGTLVRPPGMASRGRPLVVGIAAVLALVLVLGTFTTGSGPHSGDPSAGRTGLDLVLVSHLHAYAVYLLVALTVGLIWIARRGPTAVSRAASWVLAAELLQGTIGVIQFNTDLPVLLVSAHMLGAALLVVATVRLWFVTLNTRADTIARLVDAGS